MSCSKSSIASAGFVGNSFKSFSQVRNISRNRFIHQLSWYGLPASLSMIPVSSLSPPLLALAFTMTGAGSVCGADATAVVETA